MKKDTSLAPETERHSREPRCTKKLFYIVVAESQLSTLVDKEAVKKIIFFVLFVLFVLFILFVFFILFFFILFNIIIILFFIVFFIVFFIIFFFFFILILPAVTVPPVPTPLRRLFPFF